MAFVHHHLFEGCFQHLPLLDTYSSFFTPTKHTQQNKTTTEPHHTKLFFWETSKSQNNSIYTSSTLPPKKKKQTKKHTQQLPLRCPQETKLYDTERLVVAFGVTSLLLGLEGGNASMMEECQVTWPEPSLKLTVGLHLKMGTPWKF